MWLFLSLFLFAALSPSYHNVHFVLALAHTKKFFSYFNSLPRPSSSRVEHSCARRCQQRARNEKLKYFLLSLLFELLREFLFSGCLSQMKPKNMCNRFLLWIATDVCESFKLWLHGSGFWNRKNKSEFFLLLASPRGKSSTAVTSHSLNSHWFIVNRKERRIFFILLFSQKYHTTKASDEDDLVNWFRTILSCKRGTQIVRYGCSSNFFHGIMSMLD